MAAQSFVSKLPVADVATLDSDDQQCNICYSKYYLESGAAEGPVELPCKHIFGAHCLTIWLSDHESCPACRHKVLGITSTEKLLRLMRSVTHDGDLPALIEVAEHVQSMITRLEIELYDGAGDLANLEQGGAPFEWLVHLRSQRPQNPARPRGRSASLA